MAVLIRTSTKPLRNLGSSCKANNFKKGEDIIDQINQQVCKWLDFETAAGVNEKRTQQIRSNLHTIS
jgi:hypothetical protein